MKTYRPIILMVVFLALGFLANYLGDLIPGAQSSDFWLYLLIQVVFGLFFLYFIYLNIYKNWLTHGAAITYMVVGGILLLWTPTIVSILQINWNAMDVYIEQHPNLWIPLPVQTSFFAITALLVVVIGVYGLLPKPKKHKK